MSEITCDNCGVCCTSVGCPPFIDEEVNRLPNQLQQQVIELGYKSQASNKSACYWFDTSTKKCMHHEHRPQICRDFEMGGAICIMQRKFYNIS